MSSVCEQSLMPDNREYWRGLAAKIHSQRVPLSGSFALTHRCNLNCVHCYIKTKSGDPPMDPELNADEWRRILEEVKEAGCLNLLLTGGEPLLRSDFINIYSFAKMNGFLVTVFTNATLIDKTIVELFRRLPPRLVEISLYGSCAEINDRITGIPGSFADAMRGIHMLMEGKVSVRLKSMLMKGNDADFSSLEALARNLGLPFRFDPVLFPTLSGDRTPVDLRVSPARAVELEMAETDRMRQWREFLDAFRGLAKDNRLYNCGSGVNTFHVDAHGSLFPCQMVGSVRYPLSIGTFQEGWRSAFNDFRDELPATVMPCRDCEDKLLCGYCPGLFEVENGMQHVPSSYACAIGRERSVRINSHATGG